MSKTAVEWLIDNMLVDSFQFTLKEEWMYVIEQAKEMEKEQIKNAFNASRGTVHGELYYTSAESYYIEKYISN